MIINAIKIVFLIVFFEIKKIKNSITGKIK